jgi:membrane fusion protein (multidrug efflux system)
METKVKKGLPRIVILSSVLLVAIFFGWKKISYAISHESTDNAQVETLLVPVLPRVSGYVKEIAVRDFDSVKTGQLVARLDDAEMQSMLTQMRADYASAEADLANAKAALNNALVSLKVNRGNIELNSIRVEKAQKDYNRDKNLIADQAITQRQLDDSKFGMESAAKQLDNSKSDLAAAESRIGVLQALVKKSEAALESKKAQIDQQLLKLSYTSIFAPLGGKIGKKNISEGQFVQAGTPLFTIVNDTTYWIVANFKESQIRKLHPGMQVDIELDAYPKLDIKGKVETLSDATGARFALIPPDNASGNFVKVTQRIPVRINISDTEKYRDILRAGLSANVSIPLNQ